MSDTEIAFVFDKNRGLIETRVPRTDGGASVTVLGTLSASVLQGSGSGGGGDSSFPLDLGGFVPNVGSILITDGSGNPTILFGASDGARSFTAGSSGVRLETTDATNYGFAVSSRDGTNYGINITSTTGYNYGLRIRKTGAGTNCGVRIVSTNAAENRGVSISSVTGGNSGISISSADGANYGIQITKTNAGVNHGITISASGGATSTGLTITGGGGGVTVDGVNIVPLAINAHYPLVQSAHTSATKTLALADAQDIIPLSAASNAIEVTIPHSLFASGGTGRAFECRLRAMSVTGGAITFVGSGGIVITYHGKNPGVTPIAAGDFIRVLVTSATSADVWVDGVE